MGRVLHYKLVMGAVLALLALAILGGLFLLQFLTIARAGDAEVRVEVDRRGEVLWNGTVAVREATALSALQQAGREGGFAVVVDAYPGQGSYVRRIGPWEATGGEGWLFCVGDPCRHPQLAADRVALRDGDRVRWHWGTAEDGLDHGTT